MKILEVREGFIKFESDTQIALSSFIQVHGEEKCYVAQVVQVKRAGEYNIAYAKILFLFDGTLQPYDKTLPSKDCEISEFTFEIINKTLDSPEPIIIGKFAPNGICIPMDRNCFNKKLLISSDDSKNLTIILSNLQKQFEALGNVIILDMLGTLDFPKVVAGVDFKLPLNTESLEFMYEDCLNDATAESKNLIKEIFQDLSDYSKTVPFVPFNALKTIVDDMVDKAHVFKLLVLKNKLARFDKQGYFAGNAIESENLKNVLAEKTTIIDLSKLDTVFQNRYLEVILSLLEKNGGNSQIFVNISNSINKKNLKNVITNENLSTVIATHSKFKYINEIKTMFDNFIIEPSFVNNEIFKVYSTFLNAMQKGSCLIVGEGTNYIPLVSSISEFKVENIVKNETTASIENSETFSKNSEDLVNNDNEQEIIETIIEDAPIDNAQEPELVEEVKESESPIETIDKKSDEFIEKVSEEIISEQTLLTEIFSDDNTSEVANDEILDNIVEHEDAITNNVESNFSTETLDNELDEQLSNNNGVLVEAEPFGNAQEAPIIEELDLGKNDFETSMEVEISQEEIILEDNSIDESFDNSEEFSEDNSIEIIEENNITNDYQLPEDTFIESNEEIIEINEAPNEEDEIENLSSTDSIENISDVEPEIIEIDSEISDLAEDDSIDFSENSEIIPDLSEDSVELEEDSTRENDEFNQPELDVISISDDTDSFDSFGEIEELDISELQEDDIIVELEPESDIALTDEEMLDKEIVEDVDKVFTTMKDDTISDSDLDFIDELNDDSIIEETLSLEELEPSDNSGIIEELPEFAPDFNSEENDEGFIETLEEVSDSSFVDDDKEILETRKASTPMVPIYDAEIPQEDVVTSDLIDQGDSVVHAKYGHGIVEKMIKYGTKTLYSINFDNIGRRLLDPTLTEIKKA